MGRIKEKIYTERDWKDADTLDKLYMHLMEPERWELSYDHQDKLQMLRQVWAIICDKRTQRERIRLIIDSFPIISERSIGRLMKDAVHLFGDILKTDVDTELRLMYDRYIEIGVKAEKDSDYDTARRCQDSARDILLQIESRTPVERKQYTAILFTDNPAVIRARNNEYDEFELINGTETSLLEQQAIAVPSDRSSL